MRGQHLTSVVASTRYLVHPQKLATITTQLPTQDVRPVVLFHETAGSKDVATILKHLDRFEELDDVYSPDFGRSIVLLSNRSSNTLPEPDSLQAKLQDSGRFSEIYVSATQASLDLSEGPYFLQGSELHQAWRLYPDELDTFIFAVIPDDVLTLENIKYSVINSLTPDGLWREVAVPSRLYASYSSNQPLSGARMGIKDIYRLAGVKTTMMSRSFSELYGPEEQSAAYVKKLIALGAQIVGKTKMTSFASSEEPTDQWIDFHCPVNPRGDRYQSPSGSSSGAAAGLAGYEWLDFSVAGDSAGSVRAPATCNGLYSLRPSFNSTSMTGVFVNSPAFDVVGHFSRSLEDLHHIIATTLDVKDVAPRFPSRILYPLDFFPHSNPKHQQMVDEFVAVLEYLLGVKRTEFRIADRWAQCPPENANGKSLKDYLAKSAFWSLCHDYYHEFDDYRADYREKFMREPYTGTVVSFRWDIGSKVTEADYKAYLEELSTFRTWFDNNVMSTDSETLSDAIMIMPYGSANPKYRDMANEDPNTSATIGEKFISPILHMPQLVLPFAQMPYNSRITGKREHRPIASTLVGAPGK